MLALLSTSWTALRSVKKGSKLAMVQWEFVMATVVVVVVVGIVVAYLYIYIYKTETSEAPTIFHVSTIFK